MLNNDDKEQPMLWVLFGLAIGGAIGWYVHQNRRQIDNVIRPQRCGYHFPWSGQCSLPDHHAGEHR